MNGVGLQITINGTCIDVLKRLLVLGFSFDNTKLDITSVESNNVYLVLSIGKGYIGIDDPHFGSTQDTYYITGWNTKKITDKEFMRVTRFKNTNHWDKKYQRSFVETLWKKYI